VIYFLLEAGQHSRWHRVGSDEVWQYCEGEPLALLVLGPDGAGVQRVILDSSARGGQPAHVVPAGVWQAARPLGTYSLVTCTVGPGFEFADFEFLADHPDEFLRRAAAAAGTADLL
jgi:predicted cupin superfamily sugar epimerase